VPPPCLFALVYLALIRRHDFRNRSYAAKIEIAASDFQKIFYATKAKSRSSWLPRLDISLTVIGSPACTVGLFYH
jgi:hypothetical protein